MFTSAYKQMEPITGTKVDIPTEEHLKIDRNVLISSGQDALSIQDNQVNLARRLKVVPAKSSTGKETVIIVEEGPIESTANQRAENIGNSPETGHTPHTTTQLHVGRVSSTAREVHRVEIIKSIVYGGLIESITSLGVVSSAAAGDAATLSILALGLANLIGGLFVMGHDASKFPLQLLSGISICSVSQTLVLVGNKYMTPKSIPIRKPLKF